MTEPRHILLVEDEPTLQRILGSVLSDVGHEVESVGTAEAALSRLEDASAPDVHLVLSDKNLPAMNGLELLARVRERERDGHLLRGFILVTGYPSRDSALTVLAEGGDGYLVKPFRSLVHAVDEVQAVLKAPLAAHRRAHRRALQVADVLGGVPRSLEEDVEAALLLDDEGEIERVRACLERAGVRLVEVEALSDTAPGLLVAGRVEDLMAFSRTHPGTGRILADGSASFKDVVSLIHGGGGAVFDPALVPA